MGEVSQKRRSPLDFLHISYQIDLLDLLQAPDNRDQLLKELFFWIRARFWISPPPDPPDIADYLAYLVAKSLLEAVVEKLRRYFPKAARKDGATLLRWHADQAGAFLEQLCSYVDDILMEDFIKRPSDPLATRCQRVLPVLGHWPEKDMRDRPQHGKTSQLWYLLIYEAAQNLLKTLPRGPVTIESRDQRKELLKNV